MKTDQIDEFESITEAACDVPNRKMTEVIRDNEERFRTLVDVSPDA